MIDNDWYQENRNENIVLFLSWSFTSLWNLLTRLFVILMNTLEFFNNYFISNQMPICSSGLSGSWILTYGFDYWKYWKIWQLTIIIFIIIVLGNNICFGNQFIYQIIEKTRCSWGQLPLFFTLSRFKVGIKFYNCLECPCTWLVSCTFVSKRDTCCMPL